MLDAQLSTQLQAYLQNLRSPIRLIASLDDSTSAADMRELLKEIAALSDKVNFDESGTDARKPSFVVVKEGETLLIVEAMKVMNPIKSPKSGTVTQILVDNGQPVEFGEVLVVIE